MIITLFDICIFIIVTISTLFGFYRGIIYITINFLSFVSSIFVAMFAYPYVKILLLRYIENDLLNSILSGLISYIVSLIIFTFIASRVVMLFKGISCGFVDRFLGMIIGIFRGVVISVFLFTILAVFITKSYSGA